MYLLVLLSFSSFFFSISSSSFNKDLWRRLMILLSLVYPIWSLESAELGNVSSYSSSFFSISRSSFNKDLWRRLMILLSLVYQYGVWILQSLAMYLLILLPSSSQCQGLLSVRVCEEGWWSCCLLCTQYGVWNLQSLAMYLLLLLPSSSSQCQGLLSVRVCEGG